MDCLLQFDTPQLSKIHSGKVRDSFRVDAHHRLIAVTDRLSAFDQVLETPIPFKGAVLNSLSNWWFQQTADIIKNHFVREIDPC
ncbi:MAG TPA: phosphoribosylaminoimidazolesuccinocarboxamide synthase, partial [Chitinophagales bacterium]|nr:phosphoribosylaminoimidazolesuccinocarboxamide synthase [Chitinophagales bacterium]